MSKKDPKYFHGLEIGSVVQVHCIRVGEFLCFKHERLALELTAGLRTKTNLDLKNETLFSEPCLITGVVVGWKLSSDQFMINFGAEEGFIVRHYSIKDLLKNEAKELEADGRALLKTVEAGTSKRFDSEIDD